MEIPQDTVAGAEFSETSVPQVKGTVNRLKMPQLTTYEQREKTTTEAQKVSRMNNENGLAAYTQQERINLSSGIKNKIISTYQETVNFVKNALVNKNNADRAYMGIVPENVANQVKKETGVDISGYGVMMNGVDIRHIIKEHGNPVTEPERGQVAVTAEDIARVPEVIAHPDEVYLSDKTDAKGRKAIVFEKQFGDTYITIQGVSNGKKLLQTNTLYKRKGKARTTRYTMIDAQESAAPVINVQNGPPQSLSYETSVPQEKETVNRLKMPQLVDEQGRTYEQRMEEERAQQAVRETAPETPVQPTVENVTEEAGAEISQETPVDEGYLDALARDENVFTSDPYTLADRIYDLKLKRAQQQEAPPQRPAEQVTQEDLDELTKLFADQANHISSREDRINETENMVADHTTPEKKTMRQNVREAWSYFYRKMVDAGHSVTKFAKATGDQ